MSPVPVSVLSSLSSDETCFADLLKLIPADSIKGKDDCVAMTDYALMHKIYKVSLPTNFTKSDIENYMRAMFWVGGNYDTGMISGSYVSGHHGWASTSTTRKENLGFNFINVDADIHTLRPEQFFAGLIGRFDPQATAGALSNQSTWPQPARDEYTTETYRDITIYSFGTGDMQKEFMLNPPDYDQAGRALPLAVTNTNVFYATSTDKVKLMIDSSLSNTKSMADVPEYQAAAKGLAELGAYCCIIGDESLSNSTSLPRDIGEARLLRPYLAFGTGIGRDAQGLYMTLVLVHDSMDKSAENVGILIDRINKTKWIRPIDWEESWRSRVNNVQICSQDNVTLAKIYIARGTTFWASWIFEERPLLLHE